MNWANTWICSRNPKKWIFPVDSPSNVVKTMSCLPPKTGNGLCIPPIFLVKLGNGLWHMALLYQHSWISKRKNISSKTRGKKEPEPIRWLHWWWCSSGFWLRYMLSNVHIVLPCLSNVTYNLQIILYIAAIKQMVYQCCIEYDNWICIVCILGYKNRSVVTASSCLLYQVLRAGRFIDVSPSVGQTQIPSGELT